MASSSSSVEPLKLRLLRCQGLMKNVCAKLAPLLEQLPRTADEFTRLLPVLRELYSTHAAVSKEFHHAESEEMKGHQASHRVLLDAADGSVLRQLMLLLEQSIKSHPAGDIDSNSEKAEVLTVLLGCLHNFSDTSVEFVRALAASETFCVGCCVPVLTGWTAIFLAHALSQLGSRVLHKLINILYNCYFKMDTATDASLSVYDFVEPVKPLLQSEDEKMSFSALLLVCFALDESKAEYYLGQRKSISLLIRTFDSAFKNKAQQQRCLGYHVVELAKCINRIALNDVNKELLIELQLLPVLDRLLDSGTADQVSAALDVLFTLSFNPAVRGRVQKEFEARLLSLQALPEWSGNPSLRGLLFTLGLGEPANKEPVKLTEAAVVAESAAGPAFHAMISYQHESQSTVAQIRDQLRLHGIKVWIDYEQMTDGSTLSAMAEGVENSSMVLMCMSRRYKDSNNCRLEAEYAWRNGKKVVPLLMERGYKPSGWLGLILGAGLYYDFSGKYPLEDKLAELLALLRKFLAQQQQQQPQPSGELSAKGDGQKQGRSRPASAASNGSRSYREHAVPTPPFQPLPPIIGSAAPIVATAGRSRVANSAARAWTDADVIRWLQERGLSANWQQQQQRLTGVALNTLVCMRQRAPEAYYAAVQRHFQFRDFAEMADFLDALEDL